MYVYMYIIQHIRIIKKTRSCIIVIMLYIYTYIYICMRACVYCSYIYIYIYIHIHVTHSLSLSLSRSLRQLNKPCFRQEGAEPVSCQWGIHDCRVNPANCLDTAS